MHFPLHRGLDVLYVHVCPGSRGDETRLILRACATTGAGGHPVLDTASVRDTAHALDTAPVLPGSRRAPWAALWPCRAQAPCRAPARAPWGRAALWSCGRQIRTTFVRHLTGVTAVMHQLFAVIHVADRGPRPFCISCYGFIRCPVCSRLLRRATLRTSTSDMRHNCL